MAQHKQKFKVKVLVEREFEFEAPAKPMQERNESILLQALTLISPNERLAEFVVYSETGERIGKPIIPLNTAGYRDISCDADKSKSPPAMPSFKTKKKKNEEKHYKHAVKHATRQELKGLGVADGSHDQTQTDASSEAAEGITSREERATITGVLLSPSDTNTLKTAEKQLVLMNKKWAHRGELQREAPEEFELVQRERAQLVAFINNINEYGMTIAQKRRAKRSQKSARAIEALREKRDVQAIGKILNELDNLSVESQDSVIANKIQTVDAGTTRTDRQLNSPKRPSRRVYLTPCNRTEIDTLKTAIEEEQQQHDHIMDNRTSRLIAVVEKMNKKQRDRSMSPRRMTEVEENDRDGRMRDSFRPAGWNGLITKAGGSSKNQNQEAHDAIS